MNEKSERMKALREAALIASTSKNGKTSVNYAIAREIWALWWEEKKNDR